MAGLMGFGSPPEEAQPSLYDRFTGGVGGLLSGGGAYGGMLDEQQKKLLQKQALLSLGSNLLANSGYSPNRVSFGQALGNSLLSTQQQMGQQGQDMLQAMLLKTKLQKAGQGPKQPSDVQSFEYAKANGFPGSFAEWKRVSAAQPQEASAIAVHKYFESLPPEGKKSFLETQRSPVTDKMVLVNGVPTFVNPISHEQTSLSTQQSEIEAESRKQFESALAKARGTAQGEIAGGIQKKGQNASVVQGMVSMADPLIDVATGSTTGAAADKVAGWFGVALDGAKATAQLKVLQASLMTNMPRMEGPQSDADVLLYRQAAGEIGEPSVPRELKKAALRTIRALQGRYAEQAAAVPAAGLETLTQPPAASARPPLSSFQK